MLATVTSNIKSRFSFSTSTNGMNDEAVVKLRNVARGEDGLFYAMLDSRAEGLSEWQVSEKLKKYGLNEVMHEKAPAWYKQLLKAFVNPFIFILLTIAAISIITDVVLPPAADRDFKTIIVVSIMVLFSVLLRFIQEFRSNKAAEQLKSMVKTTATVLRNTDDKGSFKREIDIKEIVPGDTIFLSAGDMIPADCRIVQSKDLFVSQAMLTGESLPVEKRNLPIRDTDTNTA